MTPKPAVLSTYLISTSEFYIGLCLAVSSTLFIGSSFVIKKIALIRLSRNGQLRAGAGGFGYLREWVWWAGLITMGIGEAANFAAYAFAPASLVTPLGALSVLVASVLASKFLNENLNLLGKLGCFLCILGSTIMVIHSPKEEEVESLEVLLPKLQEPGLNMHFLEFSFGPHYIGFIVYTLLVVIVSTIIVVHLGPRYGHRNVCVYVALCSSIGSLTVMACKGLGLSIKETLSGTKNELSNWLTWTFLVLVVLFISVQMNYLNKALDLFNTGIVTPVYYVMFTSLVITASSILFNEWQHLSAQDILGNICGFMVTIVAIILLNSFKDLDISLNNVKGVFRPKRDYLSHKVLLYNDDEDDVRITRTYGTPETL